MAKKILEFASKAGSVRRVALNTIKELNLQIAIRKLTLKKFEFINKTAKSMPPGGRRSRMFPWRRITGNEKRPLKEVMEGFVLPGESFKDKTNAQRFLDAKEFTGKGNTKKLKSLLNTRRKLGKTIAEKDRDFKKLTTREAHNRVLDPSRGFPKEVRERVSKKIAARKRTALRAKGVRFVRIRGRIVPIRAKNKK